MRSRDKWGWRLWKSIDKVWSLADGVSTVSAAVVRGWLIWQDYEWFTIETGVVALPFARTVCVYYDTDLSVQLMSVIVFTFFVERWYGCRVNPNDCVSTRWQWQSMRVKESEAVRWRHHSSQKDRDRGDDESARSRKAAVVRPWASPAQPSHRWRGGHTEVLRCEKRNERNKSKDGERKGSTKQEEQVRGLNIGELIDVLGPEIFLSPFLLFWGASVS